MKWPLERKIKTEKPNNLREKYKKKAQQDSYERSPFLFGIAPFAISFVGKVRRNLVGSERTTTVRRKGKKPQNKF